MTCSHIYLLNPCRGPPALLKQHGSELTPGQPQAAFSTSMEEIHSPAAYHNPLTTLPRHVLDFGLRALSLSKMLTSGLDDVLGAVCDGHVSKRANRGDIAGGEPAILVHIVVAIMLHVRQRNSASHFPNATLFDADALLSAACSIIIPCEIFLRDNLLAGRDSSQTRAFELPGKGRRRV